MAITEKYLRVTYTLYLHSEGECEEAESVTPEKPFEFLTCDYNVLDGFVENLKDLNKGDKFDFRVPMAEAYGEYNPENVHEYGREEFTINGKFHDEYIYEGNIIEMIRKIDKSVVYAVVKEVTPLKVVLDYNHPYAGCDLQFVGTVVETRPAKESELKKFYDSLKASCSCSGGCSGCGGGCGDGSCGDGGCEGCDH